MRLDIYLTENNLFESRNKAIDSIKKGAILVDGKIVCKPSFDVVEGMNVSVVFDTIKYVSRGGYKLEGAIKEFLIDFKDKTILDIGSSTGGFTDCSLQNGAKEVYAVDVGTNQLHPSLRENPRVHLFENTNILDFNTDIQFDYLVMDVSFVSIKNVIPAIIRYLDEKNKLICLIKPQYEAGHMVGKGVIKDKSLHIKILNDVSKYLNESGLYINKIAPSPIKGGSGNIEFIAVISKNKTIPMNYRSIVEVAYRR